MPLSFALSREDVLKIVLNPQEVPGGPLEHRVDITFRVGTDYWLYCVTSAVEPRLFVDFNAQACVIIKDKKKFRRLLELQGAVKFPDALHRRRKVVYIDPLLPSTSVIDVPMSKHFRYEYQREYRYVWMPERPMDKLPYIDLELGDLQGIAELVVL